ncbi:hypothetical protein N4T77_12310 [Clostridium sp. CX1]|uniref:hypothetical protein n=1 Tax=Clostridium sp. CX1 TaxID=2978346 RepID=UPI0021C0C8B8|nr:hypothetical protein [Clostridium sp. CX1]MCT8977385.1 hypothetical protein [Clostridium sp. CX1]
MAACVYGQLCCRIDFMCDDGYNKTFSCTKNRCVGRDILRRKLRIRVRRSYAGDFENINLNSAFSESIEFEFIFEVERALDLLPKVRAFK